MSWLPGSVFMTEVYRNERHDDDSGGVLGRVGHSVLKVVTCCD